MGYSSSRRVCDHFVKVCLKKEKYNDKIDALNIHISGDNLLSFSSVIMKFFDGKFYLTEYKHSTTTTKHQTYAKEALANNKVAKRRIVIFDEPMRMLSFNYERKTVHRPKRSS